MSKLETRLLRRMEEEEEEEEEQEVGVMQHLVHAFEERWIHTQSGSTVAETPEINPKPAASDEASNAVFGKSEQGSSVSNKRTSESGLLVAVGLLDLIQGFALLVPRSRRVFVRAKGNMELLISLLLKRRHQPPEIITGILEVLQAVLVASSECMRD
ncbi:hypothetical protein HK102_002323 [Quaeritorhiza haematococci]|nr:hypothetical protein HK102_002323 [Quaeritorhiza haematococci]